MTSSQIALTVQLDPIVFEPVGLIIYWYCYHICLGIEVGYFCSYSNVAAERRCLLADWWEIGTLCVSGAEVVENFDQNIGDWAARCGEAAESTVRCPSAQAACLADCGRSSPCGAPQRRPPAWLFLGSAAGFDLQW